MFRLVARFYYCTERGRGCYPRRRRTKRLLQVQVSRTKKGCLRLNFEHFEKNGYFLTLKLIFFTGFYKDNVNVTTENYKLE